MYYSKVYILGYTSSSMKVNKMFNIDLNLAQLCSGINASALVNDLLDKHFAKTQLSRMTLLEKEKLLAKMKSEKALKEKVEELENGA